MCLSSEAGVEGDKCMVFFGFPGAFSWKCSKEPPREKEQVGLFLPIPLVVLYSIS